MTAGRDTPPAEPRYRSAPTTPEGQHPGIGEPADHGQHSVLLCDDKAEIRDAIRAMLRDDAQFRVIGEAGDGAECLDVLRAVRPDVLILDVNMPGGGPDVATAARNICPALQILVYSGNAAPRDQQRMLDAGADDYVVKTGRISPLRAGLSRAARRLHGTTPR